MRAVLLDALGTLVDLEPPAPRLRAELAARGVAVTEAEAAAAMRTEIAFYRAEHQAARDEASLDALRARCTEVLARALPPQAAGVGDLRDALLASLRFTPYPEVAPTLRELRARGLRLVVASNWDVSLHGVLRDTGLAPLVDGAVTSAEAGAPKPAAAVFEAALALADVTAAEALHAGDDEEADLAGAQAAGITPVLVARDGRPGPGGVPVVRGLDGLLTLAS